MSLQITRQAFLLPLRPPQTTLSKPLICHANPTDKSHPKPRTPRPPKTTRSRPNPPPPDPRDDRWAPENLGFLHIATITGAHGVRGEAKVVAEGHFPASRLGPGVHLQQRYLLLPGRRYPRPVAISAGRKASQKHVWILKIHGVYSREHVAKLRGARIYVKDHDRPKLASDEFMVEDLVRSRVTLLGHHPSLIGVVETVVTKDDLCHAAGSGEAGAAVAADLLEIAIFDVLAHDPTAEHGPVSIPDDHRFKGDFPANAKRVLVPFVKQVVPIVDKKHAIITLDPPKGLLDIAVVNRKQKQRPPRGLLMPAKD